MDGLMHGGVGKSDEVSQLIRKEQSATAQMSLVGSTDAAFFIKRSAVVLGVLRGVQEGIGS